MRTPMTDANPYSMPMIMEPRRAAAIIKRGLARDLPRIAFPWPMYVLSWLFGSLTPRLTDPLFARLPDKPSLPEQQ